MGPSSSTQPNLLLENQESKGTLVICKQFEFEASHSLPNHQGKCRRLHGHSYKLEVELSGEVVTADGLSDDGMILDFYVISDMVKELVVNKWDHMFLCALNQKSPVAADETIRLPVRCTTAELMVLYIAEILQADIDHGLEGITVTRIRLHETRTGYAEWRANPHRGDGFVG